MKKDDKDFNKNTGEAIRECREALRFTRNHIAKIAKCHPNTIYNIEIGKQEASLNTFLRLQRFFDVSQKLLLPDEWQKIL